MVVLLPTPLDWSFQHVRGRGKKEGNVLFNDALNTFYLRLYSVRHMVKDHPAPSPHTMTFVTLIVEHWLEREIAPWVHNEGSIRLPIAP